MAPTHLPVHWTQVEEQAPKPVRRTHVFPPDDLTSGLVPMLPRIVLL